MSGLRVVKLGGSLLLMPDLRERLAKFLARERACSNLIVVGGGELAESVRRLDHIHTLDAVECHWLCVELIGSNMMLVQQLLPKLRCLTNSAELQSIVANGRANNGATRDDMDAEPLDYLVAPAAYYRRAPGQTTVAPELAGLPQDWRTTSDALAAGLAVSVEAQELVLLKSASPPESRDEQTAPTTNRFEQWSASGLVDSAFPALAQRIGNVRIVNLRGAEYAS